MINTRKKHIAALLYIANRADVYAVCQENQCDECDLLRDLHRAAQEAIEWNLSAKAKERLRKCQDKAVSNEDFDKIADSLDFASHVIDSFVNCPSCNVPYIDGKCIYCGNDQPAGNRRNDI